MFLYVGGKGFQTGRFMAEFALDLDSARTPVVCGEEGTVEQENAFGGHQVFIFVMMS
jgi:hypothetical protein